MSTTRRQFVGAAAGSAIVGSIALLDTDPDMAKDLGADCLIEVPVFGANRFPDISAIMTAREVEEKLLVAGLQQLTGDVRETGIRLLATL